MIVLHTKYTEVEEPQLTVMMDGEEPFQSEDFCVYETRAPNLFGDWFAKQVRKLHSRLPSHGSFWIRLVKPDPSRMVLRVYQESYTNEDRLVVDDAQVIRFLGTITPN